MRVPPICVLLGLSLLANRSILSAPMDKSRAWLSDFSSSSSREMDAVDFDILRALSEDLSSHEQPDKGPERGDGSSTVAAEPIHGHPSRSEPGKRTAGTSIESGRKAAKTTTRGERNRLLMSLAEPRFLKELELKPPIDSTRRAMSFKSDDAVRDRIVSHLFANKLHWVEAKFLRLTKGDHYYRSPYQRQSRILPLVQGSAGKGDLHPIYMTANNLQVKKSRNLEGSPLNGRPYYSFWGVPDQLQAKRLPITYYGSGYLDAEDHDAVDQHVRTLLDELEHAGKAHV